MSIKKKLKFNKANPRDVLERLRIVFGAANQSQLALRLAIKPQAIISAIRRGEIPEAWLYKAAYETQISVGWLNTGKGAKYLPARMIDASAEVGETIPPSAMKLLSSWPELKEAEKEVLTRCAELLRSSDPAIRDIAKQTLVLLEKALTPRKMPTLGETK
jgi:hypothetical protein